MTNNNICGHCGHYISDNDERSFCGHHCKDVGYFETHACFAGKADPPAPTPNPEPSPATEQDPQTKTCKGCGKIFPLEEFPRHPHSRDGHTGYCRDCFRTINAASMAKAARNSVAKRIGKPSNRSAKAKTTAKAEPKPKAPRKVREVKSAPPSPMEQLTDRQLFDELVRRGYRGTLTKDTLTTDGL